MAFASAELSCDNGRESSGTPVNEPLALVDGVPDGLSLADWAEQNDVGKTTSYALVKILKALGIEPRFVRKKGAAKPSPFLEGDALAAINHLLMQHRDGKSIGQLEADHTAAIVTASQPSKPTAPASISSESDDKAAGGDLLDRLRALKLAQTTGMVLTTREARWILGRKPVANKTLERVGVNAWQALTN